MEMDESLYNLLMGSNQIVHNRGRALAYLGNAEKKRSRDEFANTEDANLDSGNEQVRHRYALKEKLRPIVPLSSTPPELPQRQTALSKNLHAFPHDLTS